MSITQKITDIIKSQIEEIGYEFVDLKYGKQGSSWKLQIFADKENGLTIDDCKKISETVSYELDRHPDLLKHAYSLEVSSPGLTRQLKKETDFKKYIGKYVKINLYKAVDNNKVFEGKIVDAANGIVIIENEKGINEEFNIDDIAKANLEVKI
jgi:ribosome maturation factor RimP